MPKRCPGPGLNLGHEGQVSAALPVEAHLQLTILCTCLKFMLPYISVVTKVSAGHPLLVRAQTGGRVVDATCHDRESIELEAVGGGEEEEVSLHFVRFVDT